MVVIFLILGLKNKFFLFVIIGVILVGGRVLVCGLDSIVLWDKLEYFLECFSEFIY